MFGGCTVMDLRYDAIYARQSIDKKGSLSIQGQIDKCRMLCEGANVKEYPEGGKSGKDTERPVLQELIKDIEGGIIKRVIVYKLDRLTRSVRNFYELYEKFKKFNVAFVSVNDSFETDSTMGRAMMGILAVFAQMERENIVQRVTDNYYYRITERGSWPGGKCPFGFRIGKNKEGYKTLIQNKYELKAVKKMFKMYASNEGTSLTKIVNTLRDEGYRTKNDSVISASAISKTLQYLVYVKADECLYKYLYTRGFKILSPIEKWDGKRSAHTIGKNGKAVSTKSNNNELSVYVTNFAGIIDSATFITVHDRLSRNEQLGRGNGDSPIGELAGLLKCEKCGYSIKCYGGRYLRCTGQVQHKLCTVMYSHMKIQELQERVANEVQAVLDAVDTRKRTANDLNALYSMSRAEQQKQLENLVTLAALGEETPEVVRKRIDEVQLIIHDLDLKIAMNDIGSLVERVDYKGMSHQERKEILKTLAHKILLYSDENSYDIAWKNHVGQ
jgi:DNA invertase Pin-like site-specific DNA recombinase